MWIKYKKKKIVQASLCVHVIIVGDYQVQCSKYIKLKFSKSRFVSCIDVITKFYFLNYEVKFNVKKKKKKKKKEWLQWVM